MTRPRDPKPFPVIDVFAGPGGLAEGFTAYRRREQSRFAVRLSIEKDTVACQTLELRRFFHFFDSPPAEYFLYLKGDLSRKELFALYPLAARAATSTSWHAELGKTAHAEVNARVRAAIGGSRHWILLGGPPCQAYSIAGRSRMRTTHADFEGDERHFLYREYLRIVARHAPPVFVLENVKGLLSATHGGEGIFQRILRDLMAPGKALRVSGRTDLRYRLHALGPVAQQDLMSLPGQSATADFLLQAEQHGIPQTRHRVIILGIRHDIDIVPDHLQIQPTLGVFQVLNDLAPIRSRLSREDDSYASWLAALREIESYAWYQARENELFAPVGREVRNVLRAAKEQQLDCGSLYLTHGGRPSALSTWFRKDVTGVTLHESRSHMREDLHRYLYAVCFARAHGKSPKLREFPSELHPRHRNVSVAVKGQMFGDRFRVQLPHRPSATVTSHISKDGHYFIHYAGEQCRSLTVREAARLQTFPDNYFFEGNRTQQFHQVGNAVPPLLARDIAAVVDSVFLRWVGR